MMLFLQGSEHVAWRNAVDTNASMSPLNSQTGSQMPNGRLGCIVRRLRLWYVDNGSRHAANKYHATRGIPFHEMFGHGDCKQVCAINIDAPKLPYSLNWIINCFEVLGESC
jgi:hypothetical protein